MVAPIRQTVTVREDGKVEIIAPELRRGDVAQVVVMVATPALKRSLTSFIGAGKGAFQSIEEIDAYIREIRDWDDPDSPR